MRVISPNSTAPGKVSFFYKGLPATGSCLCALVLLLFLSYRCLEPRECKGYFWAGPSGLF